MSKLLVLMGLIFLVLPALSADETEALRQMIAQSRTPGELHEDQLAERLKSWAGLHTLDGVKALYEIFEEARLTKDGDNIMACSFVQKKLDVPPDEVASFLLARTQENMEKVLVLEQNIRFLGAYTEDPRVPKFLASLLNDKRRLYDKHGKELIGSIPRVCDSAHGQLLRWLQKKELIKRGDPGWAWDAVFEPDRDQQIREIKPLLVKAGAMEAASAQQRKKPGGASNQLDPSSNVPQAKQSPAPQPKSATSATADESSSRSWLVWLCVVFAAIACVLWLFIRKSSK